MIRRRPYSFVTEKSGIYEYLLTGEEKKLSIRAFDRRDALAAYEKQNYKCAICEEEFDFEEMHADHIKAWFKGGHTTPENCQMLCRDCNLKKGALYFCCFVRVQNYTTISVKYLLCSP